MAKKYYEAPRSVISDLTVILDGRPRRICFYAISQYEGSHTGVGSMFVTSDEELQAAIERSPLFNRKFFLFKTENDAIAVKEENAEESTASVEDDITIVPVSVVATLNDARDYLETHFGIEKSKIPTKKSIINAALRHNISFEALNT